MLYESNICVNIITFVVQCIGNGLVVWTVAVTPSLRNNCMILICNLAIADFLNGFLVIPAILVLYFNIVFHKEVLQFWFNLGLAFGYAFHTVSMVTLALMSIDRCIAIVLPMKYKVFMTKTKVNLLLIGTWVFGISVGTIEGFKLLSREVCFLLTIISIVNEYFIIVISYVILIVRLKRQDTVRAQMVSACTTQDLNIAQRKRDQKLAKTVGLVIGVFTFSWCLLAYTMLFPPREISQSLLSGTLWGRLFSWGVCLSFASTAINPLIYLFQSESMRKAAKNLIMSKLVCISKTM